MSPDGSDALSSPGTARARSTSNDFVTIAYDSATGAERWVARYDGPFHGADAAGFISLSPDGSKVFVAGSSFSGSNDWDWATVAYEASSGTQLWAARYGGPGPFPRRHPRAGCQSGRLAGVRHRLEHGPRDQVRHRDPRVRRVLGCAGMGGAVQPPRELQGCRGWARGRRGRLRRLPHRHQLRRGTGHRRHDRVCRIDRRPALDVDRRWRREARWVDRDRGDSRRIARRRLRLPVGPPHRGRLRTFDGRHDVDQEIREPRARRRRVVRRREPRRLEGVRRRWRQADRRG